MLVALYIAYCEVAIHPSAYDYNYPATALLSVTDKDD